MFRFIHAADLHLDSPLHGLEAHEGAPISLLRGATRRAFENLVTLAIEEQVAFIGIAGDVYDGDWKDYSTGLFFRRQLVRLREARIPVYLISGNHDAASVISKKLELPDNVHQFPTRAAASKEVIGLPVVIHGRGFPNRAVPENLAKEYPPAVAERFNLGLLHTSLTGRPGHESYAPCSEQDLRDKGYAYWALGHVHQPEIISRDPFIVFAGNCQGRHIKETGPRGCWLIAVNDALAVEAIEWHDLDVVRWTELRIDLTGASTDPEALSRIREVMAQSVAKAAGRPLAARVALGGCTCLHGSLHREAERWRAEILAAAQDHGIDAIWIERIDAATTPVYSLRELAGRDALTKIVVETLDQAPDQLGALPAEIEEMLGLVPSEIRLDLEKQWAIDQRAAVFNDVRSIILDALSARGGSGA